MTLPRRFDARGFVGKVVALARANPGRAVPIYAEASMRLRAESARLENAQSAMGLHSLAAELEMLAAQATVPPTGLSGEIPAYAPGPAAETVTTDLAEIAGDMEAAKRGEDGRPLDDLVATGRLAHIQQAREREGASPITPSSAKPGTTLFGSTALCQFGGAVGNASSNTVNAPVTGQPAYQETQVIRWDGREQEAMVLTVTAFALPSGAGGTWPAAQNGTGTNLGYRPFAHLFFGNSRGSPCEALIDVGRGCQVTLATSYLSVNVGMGANAPAQSPGSMVLGASMGFYAAARVAPTVYTQYADSVAAAGSKTLVIPLYAASIIAAVGQNLANWTLALQRADGTTLGTVAAAQTVSGEVTLPGDAAKIVATNNGGGTDSIEIVYRVAL